MVESKWSRTNVWRWKLMKTNSSIRTVMLLWVFIHPLPLCLVVHTGCSVLRCELGLCWEWRREPQRRHFQCKSNSRGSWHSSLLGFEDAIWRHDRCVSMFIVLKWPTTTTVTDHSVVLVLKQLLSVMWLFIRPHKCLFYCLNIVYLGIVVDPANVVLSWRCVCSWRCVSCVQASPRCWPCPPSSPAWMRPCPECPTSRQWTFTCGSASSLSSCRC